MKISKKQIKNVAIILMAMLIFVFRASTAVLATNKEAAICISASYKERSICRNPKQKSIVSISLYEITEKQEKTSFEAIIRFLDGTYESRVIGTFEEYSVGRFGAFDGVVFRENQLVPITISFSFINQNNCFLIAAIGEADDYLEVFCFGEYTDEVRKLNHEKNEYDKNEREKELAGSKSPETMSRLDNECRYQNTSTSYQNGYEHVTISAYHANEVGNSGNAQVFAKINSHAFSFENYLQNVYGLNASGSIVNAYPDEYIITVLMNSQYLDFDNEFPTSGVTTYSFSLPVYLPVIGLQTFSFSYTVSQTNCIKSSTNPGFGDNRIQWDVYKHYGFTANQMDGYYNTTNKGGMVKARVFHNSSISSPVNVLVQTSGQMRYQVDYMVPPNNYYEEYDLYQYYLWAKTANCNSVIKLIP